nr:mannosylglycoprotein endo-beta-mannosidase [Quercus suber]
MSTEYLGSWSLLLDLLAFLVHPPVRIPHKVGQGGDHEIGKNVATQYVLDLLAFLVHPPVRIPHKVGQGGDHEPVKIFDLHLVSLFFDDFKRVYLHATTELENRRAWVAECSLNVQVTMGVEGNICLVEHLQTLHLSFLAGSHMQYMFPEGMFRSIRKTQV